MGGTHIAIFVLATAALALSPGPNMVYMLSRTVSQVRRAGIISLLGVETGFFVHPAAWRYIPSERDARSYTHSGEHDLQPCGDLLGEPIVSVVCTTPNVGERPAVALWRIASAVRASFGI
jgi:hypothetical protein